jgi:NAD(P)-dependent dehydrogenase (short-subunit alcohol dehydrogenase family)
MIDLSSFPNNLNILIFGASGGIGQAFVRHFTTHENVKNIHVVSRRDINNSHDKITAHVADITQDHALKELADKIGKNTPIDIIIVATGMLHDKDGTAPEKSLRDIKLDNFEKIFAINTYAPALVMKHFLPLLNPDSKSVFATLSARVGSISDNQLGGWYSYRASKAAVNMLIKTASIEVARRNKTACVIGLHPGTVETNLSDPFQGNVPNGKLFTPEYSTQKMLEVINNITSDKSGNLFAYDGEIIPA